MSQELVTSPFSGFHFLHCLDKLGNQGKPVKMVDFKVGLSSSKKPCISCFNENSLKWW